MQHCCDDSLLNAVLEAGSITPALEKRIVDDFDAAHELHEKMGCIIRENPRMGLYFIADPEGQWIEILPAR